MAETPRPPVPRCELFATEGWPGADVWMPANHRTGEAMGRRSIAKVTDHAVVCWLGASPASTSRPCARRSPAQPRSGSPWRPRRSSRPAASFDPRARHGRLRGFGPGTTAPISWKLEISIASEIEIYQRAKRRRRVNAPLPPPTWDLKPLADIVGLEVCCGSSRRGAAACDFPHSLNRSELVGGSGKAATALVRLMAARGSRSRSGANGGFRSIMGGRLLHRDRRPARLDRGWRWEA